MKLLGDKHDNQIVCFDPGCASLNVGDEIISDCARRYIEPLFENEFMVRLSSHQSTSFRYRRYLKDSKMGFVLGSNLLKSGMLFGFRQWDVSLFDSLQIEGLILVGCGWQNYDKKIDRYSRMLYRRLLSHTYIHSVRDEYTRQKMVEMGFENVLNTGCATMWGFTKDFCKAIPSEKAKKVVVTVTDYRRDEIKDKLMFEQLFTLYETIYVWLQGSCDMQYLADLGVIDKCQIVKPSLEAYDAFLDQNEDVDYVGTRLHGGIRAMQHKKRTLIVSIDNRAREMSRDFNLPIIERMDIDNLAETLEANFETSVSIDEDAIAAFLGQFKNE